MVGQVSVYTGLTTGKLLRSPPIAMHCAGAVWPSAWTDEILVLAYQLDSQAARYYSTRQLACVVDRWQRRTARLAYLRAFERSRKYATMVAMLRVWHRGTLERREEFFAAAWHREHHALWRCQATISEWMLTSILLPASTIVLMCPILYVRSSYAVRTDAWRHYVSRSLLVQQRACTALAIALSRGSARALRDWRLSVASAHKVRQWVTQLSWIASRLQCYTFLLVWACWAQRCALLAGRHWIHSPGRYGNSGGKVAPHGVHCFVHSATPCVVALPLGDDIRARSILALRCWWHYTRRRRRKRLLLEETSKTLNRASLHRWWCQWQATRAQSTLAQVLLRLGTVLHRRQVYARLHPHVVARRGWERFWKAALHV
jgi:hypothetical protein